MLWKGMYAGEVGVPRLLRLFDKYDIKEASRNALLALGFEIGDDLTKLTPEQLKDVGIKPLEFTRLCAWYREYKHARD